MAEGSGTVAYLLGGAGVVAGPSTGVGVFALRLYGFPVTLNGHVVTLGAGHA